MRPVALCSVLFASAAVAGGKKVKIIDLVDMSAAAAPRALLASAMAAKPGAAREATLLQLDARVREKGADVEDPDQIDGMAAAVFQRIFEDMAAATDVWKWDGDDAPRGDVVFRGKLLVLPGQATSGFTKEFTVTPKGKRIDRAYADQPATITVTVAKSEADWQAAIDGKGWGAALHQVKFLDDVARVGVTVLSPGGRHQRPVWLAYFKRAKAAAPWEFALLDPATAKEQRLQEANIVWVDPKPKAGEAPKLSDAQRKLLLAVRMEDVRLIPLTRTALLSHEASFFGLSGLTVCPVDAKSLDWLDRYKADASPMVRAAAVVKTLELGGKVTGGDLADIVANLKIPNVVLDAQARLDTLLDGGKAELTVEQQASLAQLAGKGEVRSLPDVVRVKGEGKTTYFRKRPYGWEEINPKK